MAKVDILIIYSELPSDIAKMAAAAPGAMLALAPWATWKQLGEIG
jgi:hypothetical protein